MSTIARGGRHLATAVPARGRGAGVDLLARRADGAYDGEDGHQRTLFEERLKQDAVHRRRQVKVGLVGLDLGDHVPGGDRIALVFAPRRYQAVFNRVAKLGHLDCGRHLSGSSFRPRRHVLGGMALSGRGLSLQGTRPQQLLLGGFGPLAVFQL